MKPGVAASRPEFFGSLLVRGRALPVWLTSLFLLGSLTPDSHAQVITNITASGTTGTVITPSGTTYNITGGTRPGGGPNLFHSFGQFSIGALDTARFNNTPATPTSNILSRVTGGNPSNIFGTIDTLTYPGATLWLINPAGVVFGPTATLNVAGSVNIATADYLRTTDGARYYADLGKVSTLSMTPVAAFGFLGPSPPTAVRVKGSNLAVPDGQTLSLVGGNRTFEDTTEAVPVTVPAGVTMAGGRLSAASGRVNAVSLGTVASAAIGGEVVFTGSGLTATVTPVGFTTMGTILLNQTALVDTSGNPGGTIFMRGGQLTLDGNQESACCLRTSLVSDTTGPADHPSGVPGIDLNADNVTITGHAFITAGGRTGSGNAADINIVATDSIAATGRSGVGNDYTIGTETFSAGNAGNITLTANTILLIDAAILANSNVGASGAAGAITLQGHAGLPADTVRLTGDTGLFTFAGGNGASGAIRILARDISLTNHVVLSSLANGTGDAGGIELTQADTILLNDRVFIETFAMQGRGGKISLHANSGISITDADLASTVNGGSRPGGDIVLHAPALTIRDSVINAETLGDGPAGSVILEATTLLAERVSIFDEGAPGPAAGAAGQIIVQGLSGPGTLPSTAMLTDSSLRTSVFGTGEGGAISIGASSALTLTNTDMVAFVNRGLLGDTGDITLTAPTITITGGTISTDTFGSRRAGSVALQDVGNLTLSGGATLSSRSTSAGAGAGDGGTVTITASSFNATGSTVTTSAQQAGGGDITISADNLSLGPGSIVSAQSAGPGDAGSILLTSGNTIVLNGGAITTTAAQASGGDITLTASYMTRLINSQITSSVQGGPATSGGNITLDPQFVILQNSQILAQAFQGTGGNISIVAGVLLVDPNSVIDASSQLGVSGSVNLQAPIQNLSGALVPLRQPLIQVAMSGDRCAASPTGQLSSFVQAGRDGVPPEPGSFLSSPLALEDLEARPPKPGQGAVRPPARLGQRLEPAAGFPVSASPATLVAGCSSGGSTRLPQRSDLLTP
jgi:filamentous hemagglutinin family protein